LADSFTLDDVNNFFPEQEEPAEDNQSVGSFTVSDVDALFKEPVETAKESFSVEDVDSAFKGQKVDIGLDINSVLAKYQDSLTKEDFLEDADLQELVYQSLEARGRDNPSLIGKSYGVLTRLTGGANVGTYSENLRDVPFEDVFETWQNWQRGISAGHSVTVANEAAYVANLDDDKTKAQLGAGYLLFDSMDNAFTGEGSWRETGDAVWDYTRNAVWDPINILAFGAGKAISAAGTKAGSTAFKGVMKAAAKKNLTGAVLRSAPYVAPDLAFNLGSDALEQYVKIDTGAQDSFSVPQSAATAAGTILMPAVASGLYGMRKLRKSKVFKDSAFDTPDLSVEKALTLPKEEAWKILKEKVNTQDLNKLVSSELSMKAEGFTDRFGNIAGDPSKFNDWAATKIYSEPAGKKVTQVDLPSVFFNNLFFDSVNDSGEVVQKGYISALNEAGFRVTPSMLEEKGGTTSVFAQSLRFIDDDVMKKLVSEFEEASGVKMNMGYTSNEVSQFFAANSSSAGKYFNLVSNLRKTAELGFDPEDIYKMVGGAAEKSAEPKTLEFSLSIYKRLLTSHLATTGANLKGFSQLVSINTFADLFSTAAYTTQKVFYDKVKGDPVKGAIYANRAFGSWNSTKRRFGAALSPDTEIEYTTELFEKLPEKYSEYVQGKLFRDISGDGGIRDNTKMYDIDGPVSNGIDWVTARAQDLTLVRMQDSLSKTWAFGANFDRALERQYGVTASEFFADPKRAFELNSKPFQKVLDEAVFRTLRETASVNWSLLPAKNGMRGAAKMVEQVTNKSAIGFVIPFGSFLNTTVATLGDLSGVNLVRHIAKVGMGKTLDYADADAGELMGKFVVGVVGVAVGVPQAYEKVLNGLAWDQAAADDGSLKEKTFIWPESVFDLSSQIVAHAIVPKEDMSVEEMVASGNINFSWDRIPDSLWAEFLAQSGGQAVRDLDDVVESLRKTLVQVRENPADIKLWEDAILGILSRPIQGGLRPLDPINQIVGVTTGQDMNRDIRQGAKNINEMFKYVNNIVPIGEDLPTRADATSGLRKRVDAGKQIMGNRTARPPNLTEAMFNAAGFETWAAVRWNGPPEVKNTMDLIASQYFELESRRQMKEHPDFFKYSQDRKAKIIETMNANVKKKVIEQLENSTPSTLNMVRILSGKSQKKVDAVMEALGIEGDLVDLLDQEDGLAELKRIDFYVDNYDDIFYSDIK
jgi:hypothetical protein